MKARDVMVSPVITVKPDASVKELAKLLLERQISAVPVVDDHGKLVGIVSEGDLLHRAEAETQRRRPWWLLVFTSDEALAADYIKEHSRKVADVMTKDVITAGPDTPLHEIARALERHAIKRVPIVQDGQIVGIVSRANLIQAVASDRKKPEIAASDKAIREKLLAHLQAQRWADTGLVNATVTDGVVDLWGVSNSDVEQKAIRIAAESIPGVVAVNDHLIKRPRTQGY
jgi:CBS-domain-containing membrane protein